ncbi:hypothetical protein [Brevibacillus laterosporus]|uniref:hypothetical protein n=1 Tax=Brevibacillus laterosporus TaxID=1465 RepID=UPI00215CAFBD|nr:hypothetical protein [Brevibacillus laterosporus]MCR8994709.1 hypothetical protein [Brevibacillus laterosporus]
MKKSQELLSTFEMIEKIAIGQEAVILHPNRKIIVIKEEDGSIIVEYDSYSEKHVGEPLPLIKEIIEAKWILKEVEINLPTALRLITEGKTVRCYYKDVVHEYSDLTELISLDEVYRGKWVMFKR